jgi:hypothetical protein
MTAHPNGVPQAKAVEVSRGTCSLLTINGGSSSIRFALYEEGEPLRLLLIGKVDRVGLSGTNLSFKDSTGLSQDTRIIDPAVWPKNLNCRKHDELSIPCVAPIRWRWLRFVAAINRASAGVEDEWIGRAS